MSDKKPPLPSLLSIKDAAIAVGVSDKTIRRWIAEGRLDAVRVGPKLIRVNRESLMKLLGGPFE